LRSQFLGMAMTQELRHIWSLEHEDRGRHVNLFGMYFTTDTGLTYRNAIPETLPAHIAAAYQVDTTQEDAADQILDIILHQFHIPNLLEEKNWEDDVAFKAGMKKKIVNHPEIPSGKVAPVMLYTAETDEEAVEAHMMRIKEVKKRILYVPYTEVDPKTLRHSAAQMFHVTKDVEEVEPVNPVTAIRERMLSTVADDDMENHRRYIQATRLWTHGKDPDPSLRTTSRLGPVSPEERNARPKNHALVRKHLNFKFEPTWD
jgi:hypothetical protein